MGRNTEGESPSIVLRRRWPVAAVSYISLDTKKSAGANNRLTQAGVSEDANRSRDLHPTCVRISMLSGSKGNVEYLVYCGRQNGI